MTTIITTIITTITIITTTIRFDGQGTIHMSAVVPGGCADEYFIPIQIQSELWRVVVVVVVVIANVVIIIVMIRSILKQVSGMTRDTSCSYCCF